MFIRNQAKNEIYNTRGIVLVHVVHEGDVEIIVDWVGNFIVGIYSTKEKAKKVVNEIYHQLDIERQDKLKVNCQIERTFQIPLDSEVE